ncbi:tubulin--tyrosine ligase-like protein [Musa troglodytarum]|uniref:Tubulin--tyrosine ligase-like protein n=1 Tax=Musa troglodytarum TaxID=320322 RepID=A0A9E7LES4_9LILI|nr:tubulin--tyrosine ligase-like protein [Musa troglodytarum]
MSNVRFGLREVPGLAERMATLMCVDLDLKSNDENLESETQEEEKSGSLDNVLEILQKEMDKVKERGVDAAIWLELEALGIDDEMLKSLELSTKFPNLVALNLWGNKLEDAETIIQEVTKCRRLKAIWLNDNRALRLMRVSLALICSSSLVCSCLLRFFSNMSRSSVCIFSGDRISKLILDGIPGLEIYNSCFTSNFGEWALGFCGSIFGADNPGCLSECSGSLASITTLDLSNRCVRCLPKAFSPIMLPSLSHLNIRGNQLDQISVDDLLQLLKSFTLQTLEVDIPGPLGNSALQILEYLPNLSFLNGISASVITETGKHVIDSALQPRLPEWAPSEPLPDRVIGAMWLYLMTYRLADEEKIDETPVWYVMDELGSALRHSDDANFRVAPFLFMPDGKLASAVSFSVLWPIQDVHHGEECTRDFLFGIGEDKQRSARLTAWFHTPENYFIQEFKKYQQQLASRSLPAPKEALITRSILQHDGHSLQVYTDIPHVEEFLTHPKFVLTTNPKDADIIWTSMQVDPEVKKAFELTDLHYTNQFPFEACLVMKHHLAETILKAAYLMTISLFLDSMLNCTCCGEVVFSMHILTQTKTLSSLLTEFCVNLFLLTSIYTGTGRPEWLQPTYNLETQLSQLIGDYFVRKQDALNNLWILKPWNMARTIDTTVTEDLSAIIRLMETGPKICQKYIEHPALFKGRKFDLRYIVLVRSMDPVQIFLFDVFWNYRGRLNHMNTPEFVREFEEEHQVNWQTIHQGIQDMIRSVFDSAAAVHPEMHNPQSRAMYGVDVMLDHLFKPKLLEVTYCPDCGRACKYDTEAIVGNGGIFRGRDFFNTVFECLFLGKTAHVTPL